MYNTSSSTQIATLGSEDDGEALAAMIAPAALATTLSGYAAAVSGTTLVWEAIDTDMCTSISGASVTFDTSSYTYDGNAKTPAPTVTLDGTALTVDTDYTVYYVNNSGVGTAIATVLGTGSYTGIVTATFTIDPVYVEVPSLTAESFTYNGSEQTAVAATTSTIIGSDTTLLYTVGGDYAATDAGSYTATVSLGDVANYRWVIYTTSETTDSEGNTVTENTTSYSADDQEIEWTIAKAEQVLSFASESVSKHADTSSFVNELSGVAEDAAVTYASSSEDVAVVGYTSGKVTIDGAGSCTITASIAETDNYNAAELSYTLEVSDHSYGDGVVTAATCTTAGYTTYTCTYDGCGDSYTADETAALGHSYDEGAVTTAATCTTDGVLTYTCSVCGDTYTEAIAATGHTEGEAVIENNVEATCTADGSYDTVVYCSVCGVELSRETTTVAATGHDYDEGVVTTAATCTEDGVMTYTCANDSSHTYTEAIAATGHDYVGTVTTEATCGADGVMTYTCANDSSHTYTEAIAATGEHTYGAGVLSEDGQTLTFTCTVCGYSYPQDVSAVYEAAYEDGYDDADEAANDTTSETSAYNVGYNAGVADATPASLSGATVALASTSVTYTGKAIEPAVAVTLDGTVLVEGTDYTVVYLNNTDVGTATVLVVGAGSYSGAAVGSFAIVQAKQSLKVTKKAKTAKYSKVKKKAVTLKAITKVSGAKGTLSYSLVSAKKGSKSFKAKFSVNAKNGKVTVKKGTKKGTYKVKVKVSAAATAGYAAASKTVTVKIKVK